MTLGWTYLDGSLVKKFFSALKDWRRGYRELHFSIRGRADIISTETIVSAFGLPSMLFLKPNLHLNHNRFFEDCTYTSTSGILVADATLSALSIMAHLDTLQKLFVSIDSRIDARLNFVTPIDTNLEVDGNTEVIVAHETMPILQTSSDVAAKIFTSTIDIPNSTGQVDGEIFIHATDTSVDIIIRDDPSMVQVVGKAVTPIVEITN
ncbi:hypothetical protein AAG906_037392 [Vitis piasezkii]